MSYGPQLPPHLQRSEDSESDEEVEGPKLPSVACRGPKPVGPQMPGLSSEQDSSEEDNTYGPKLPSKPQREKDHVKASSSIGPQLPSSKVDESSDDDDVVGPKPPKPEEEVSEAEAILKSFEARAQR